MLDCLESDTSYVLLIDVTNFKLLPCIMSVQYTGGCAVQQGMFNTPGAHEYSGGCHEYTGGYQDVGKVIWKTIECVWKLQCTEHPQVYSWYNQCTEHPLVYS